MAARRRRQVQSGFATNPSRGGHHRLVPEGVSGNSFSPTLWNRTRTSRASAERADQLRKSGYERRTSRHRESGSSHDPPKRAAQIIIIVLQLSESGAQRAHVGPACARFGGGRTSRLHAFALAASAPRASMRSPLTRAHQSRFEILIRDLES
jgi:hypothetical protein